MNTGVKKIVENQQSSFVLFLNIMEGGIAFKTCPRL